MKNCFFQKIIILFILALFVVSCGDSDIAGGNIDTGGNVDDCNSSTTLYSLITNGTIPADLTGYDQASRDVFSPYPSGAKVVGRYVAPGGNVKSVLDGIKDASASTVYAVLIAPGTYNAGAEMAMKNYVAIIGGQCSGTSPEITNTILSGGKTRRVFNNTGITNTAVLYGVTVADGKTTSSGGGMYNNESSPTLTEVTFSGNTAGWGGGMHNNNSSPVLTRVTFSGNTANFGGGMGNTGSSSSPVLTRVNFFGNTVVRTGGGIYNTSSRPVLTGVTLSGNTAGDAGGGMANHSASPLLIGVTFSGNTATEYGGGMYNDSSSPILTGVTLSGNTAAKGGGMANDDYINGVNGPRLVNTILWRNTATSGNQIYINNGTDNGPESLYLYNSIVQGGLPSGYASGTSVTLFNGGGFASSSSVEITGLDPIVVSFASIITTDPSLATLADNGGVPTHAITSTSSAVNAGLYVKRSGTTFYYSSNGSNWYSNPELTTTATPPANAVDLTATDATGRNRSGRPDIGAYEAR